jgi:hypothetical protein
MSIEQVDHYLQLAKKAGKMQQGSASLKNERIPLLSQIIIIRAALLGTLNIVAI